MKSYEKQLFKEHLKDGMIKTCIQLLNRESHDSSTYYDFYVSLSQMIVQLQQNVGPIAHDVYISYLLLPKPIYRKEV